MSDKHGQPAKPMTACDFQRKVVERIARENTAFYSAVQGRAMLSSIEHTFEQRWIYLLELVQNAIDAGAKRLSILPTDDGLIVEHDGQEPLSQAAVEAMSHVFRSTKGASSVGFMGIGFKSIFRRFLQAQVSGFGWSFRYSVSVSTGEEFGDRQPDYLGAVVPVWDESIPQPHFPYTTRFQLTGLVDSATGLAADLAHVFPDDDPTVLALLGYAGLREISTPTTTWRIRVEGETPQLLVSAVGGKEPLRWRLFIQEYSPSRDAVARFLERRRLQPAESEKSRVYAEAQRPRRVVGVVPVDANDMPVLPSVGRMYATLPTTATWPFRMHLNADWLVNVSRTGLPFLEDNEWQREIIDSSANVLASYLVWLTESTRSPAALRAGFELLALPKLDGATTLDPMLASPAWMQRLRAVFESISVWPAYLDSGLEFVAAAEACGVPKALMSIADRPEMLPHQFFAGPAITADVVGRETVQLLIKLGLWRPLTADALNRRWAGGPRTWWQGLGRDKRVRPQLLIDVWAAVAEAAESAPDWDALQCVLTENGSWLDAPSTEFMGEPGPSDNEPLGQRLLARLQRFYPLPERTPSRELMDALRVPDQRGASGARRVAREWYEGAAAQVRLDDIVQEAVQDALGESPVPQEFFIALAQWARQRNRPSFVTHVVVEEHHGRIICEPPEAIVAEPYVARGQLRRQLFSGYPAVVSDYVDADPFSAGADAWRLFFEARGALGPLRVQMVNTKRLNWDQFSVAEFAGWSVAETPVPSRGRAYTLTTRVLSPPLRSIPPELIAPCLEENVSVLRGAGHRDVEWFSYGLRSRRARKPADWVGELQELAWVPNASGQLLPPSAVLPRPDPARAEVPVAQISEQLINALTQEGLTFGTAIPHATEVRRLQYTGSSMSAQEFAGALRRALDACAVSEEERLHLASTLAISTLPSESDGRVSFKRLVRHLGSGFRSGLDGWTVAVTDLPVALQEVLADPRLPLPIPDTTTGTQALEYLQDVWRRAASGEIGFIQSIRTFLPAAYTYVLDDLLTDASLSAAWDLRKADAWVFGFTLSGERTWAALHDERRPIYDDLREPILRQFLEGGDRLIVTAGHFGELEQSRRRVVDELGIPTVSEELRPVWKEGAPVSRPDWSDRFKTLTDLLRVANDGGSAEDDELNLVPRATLALQVREREVPVFARVNGNELAVAGTPPDFAVEAAGIVLDYYRPGSDTKLAPRVTMMLSALDDAPRFLREARRFVQDYAPDYVGIESEQDAAREDIVAPPVQVVDIRLVSSDDTGDPGGSSGVDNSDSIEAHRERFDSDSALLAARIFGPSANAQGDTLGVEARAGRRVTSARSAHPSEDQARRGQRGEEEFLRRVSGADGWSGLRLVADRTRDGCGYDFLCKRDGQEMHVEVKTFTATGNVVITPNEWQAAVALRERYCLIGFLDNGCETQSWPAYSLTDPYPALLRESNWQLTANLSAPARAIFQL